MALSAEQFIEKLAGMDSTSSFANVDVPDHTLTSDELDAAKQLVRAPFAQEQRKASKQAFMLLTMCHHESLMAELLRIADESLLQSLDEFIQTHALPFFDIELVGELDKVISDHALSPVRRLMAAQMVQSYALLHPEYYGRVVKVLGARLQDFENNPAKVNAELVDACVNLQADELMPAIRKVFSGNNVKHQHYHSVADVEAAMSAPETAFEAGLESFMFTKELDEIRQELEKAFASRTCAAASQDEFPLSNIAELDGFLHAIATSPTPVARSLWVEQLAPCLLEDEDEQGQEYRVDKITTYYAQVKDAMVIGECEPHFEVSTDSGVSNLHTMQPWARGYLLGLELWTPAERKAASELESYSELTEFLQAMAKDEPLPEQYQSLAHIDYAMILQLMTQRVFSDIHGSSDSDGALDDEGSMQDFFDNFS